MWWSIIGLVFDITGVILLYIGTERLNKIVVKILSVTTIFFERNTLVDILKHFNHKELQDATNSSKGFSLLGMFFLIVGFFLQAVGTILSYCK